VQSTIATSSTSTSDIGRRRTSRLRAPGNWCQVLHNGVPDSAATRGTFVARGPSTASEMLGLRDHGALGDQLRRRSAEHARKGTSRHSYRHQGRGRSVRGVPRRLPVGMASVCRRVVRGGEPERIAQGPGCRRSTGATICWAKAPVSQPVELSGAVATALGPFGLCRILDPAGGDALSMSHLTPAVLMTWW
jgi:hypothetical protein